MDELITHLSVLVKNFLRRRPFLSQPSPFIRAWDRHQETQKCATDGWVAEVVNEEVNCVSREKVKNALRRTKKSKAVGPDEFPVEV